MVNHVKRFGEIKEQNLQDVQSFYQYYKSQNFVIPLSDILSTSTYQQMLGLATRDYRN